MARRTKKELEAAKTEWLKKYKQTELHVDWHRHRERDWEEFFTLKRDPDLVQDPDKISLDRPFNLYSRSAKEVLARQSDNFKYTSINREQFFSKSIDAIAYYTKRDGNIDMNKLFGTYGGMSQDYCIKVAWGVKYCGSADKFMEQVFQYIKEETGASNQELL